MKIEIADTFPFTVEQAAMLTGCSIRTIQRAIKRFHDDPTDRYALKSRQTGPRGKICIEAADLFDYRHRAYPY